jgi:hypothetical protein
MVIASEWKLPDFVVEAVQRHPDADVSSCAYPELIRLVALSDQLALMVLEAPGVEQVDLGRVPLSEGERRHVLVCTATDEGCLIEVKPFAMDRTVSALWSELGRRTSAAGPEGRA